MAAGWAWLQAMAGVADAWRGRPAPGAAAYAASRWPPAAWRSRACPPRSAHADTDGPRADPLAGLPLPERAEGPAHRRHHAVVVRAGDTLWALAARDLPAPATDRQVSARWQRVYRRNRAVIGPDPDLIRPGQVLKLTKEKR